MKVGMKNAWITFLLIVSGFAYPNCLAQNIPGDRKPIPGAEKIYLAELEASRTDLERVESLLTLSAYYAFSSEFQKADPDKAISYADQAKKLSTDLNYQDGINEGRLLIATTYLESGKDSLGRIMLDTAFADITKVREQSKKHGQPEREIRALRQLSTIYLSRDQYDLAEAALLEIIEIIKARGFSNAHYTYDRLTALNLKREKFDKSLLYGLETIKSMKITGDSVLAGFFYLNLGLAYNNAGQFEKSLISQDAAFNSFKAYNSGYLYDLLDGMTWTRLKLKRNEEVISLVKNFSKNYPPVTPDQSKLLELVQGNSYRMTKQYELAEPHYLQLEKMEKSKHEWDKAIGQFYAEWGKFEKARPYLEAAIKSMKPQAHLHYLMYMVDSAQGNYHSAMRHLLENKKLDDSAYYVTKAKALQEMQVKYETEMKDRDLAFLKQESLLQEAKFQQAATTRNMFIGGVVMLLLLLTLVYSRYRLKQRANEEMNKKNLMLQHLVNEKEWLLKEVHHRVKNNLQTVLSLLESQSRQLSKEALGALQESQNRVYAMSLIHKKLYQSTDVSSINMEDYLRDLVQHLREGLSGSNKIRYTVQIDPIVLDVSQAVPIGLIVNEALTNSIKYAFPIINENSEVSISLKKVVNEKIVLHITDNGIGMAEEKENTQSLGLKLMRGLTEDIDGTFFIEVKHGVKIMIEFVANIPFQKMAKKFASQLVAEDA